MSKWFLGPNWRLPTFVIVVQYVLFFWNFYFLNIIFNFSLGVIIFQSINLFISPIIPASLIVASILLGRKKAFVLYLIAFVPISVYSFVNIILSPLGSSFQLNFYLSEITNLVFVPISYIWLNTELLKRNLGLIKSVLIPIVALNVISVIVGAPIDFLFLIVQGILFTFFWTLILHKLFSGIR